MSRLVQKPLSNSTPPLQCTASEFWRLSGGYEGRQSELLCAVLCSTVVHNVTHICEQLLHFCMLGLDFFLCLFRFCFMLFLFSLGHFVLVLFAFVLGLVSSVPSQETGWEERL